MSAAMTAAGIPSLLFGHGRLVLTAAESSVAG